MIDIKSITEKLILELSLQSDTLKVQAQGAALLYSRIREAVEKFQGDVPKSEESQVDGSERIRQAVEQHNVASGTPQAAEPADTQDVPSP